MCDTLDVCIYFVLCLFDEGDCGIVTVYLKIFWHAHNLENMRKFIFTIKVQSIGRLISCPCSQIFVPSCTYLLSKYMINILWKQEWHPVEQGK